ncbi:MAG: hypothetical protein WDO69_30025 [Pseudomonadota bacterium]
MTQAISSVNVSGFAGELAALQLENDANQSESSRMQRDAARESYLDQAQQQIDALHAAASATRNGALVGASLTIAGGACQIGAASFQFDADVGLSKGSCLTEIAKDKRIATILGDLGSASSKLADPVKAILGDSTAERYQAIAKQHEMLAAQAQWQAGDASAEIDKADKRADKELDIVQEIQRDQSSATNSLISRI